MGISVIAAKKRKEELRRRAATFLHEKKEEAGGKSARQLRGHSWRLLARKRHLYVSIQRCCRRCDFDVSTNASSRCSRRTFTAGGFFVSRRDVRPSLSAGDSASTRSGYSSYNTKGIYKLLAVAADRAHTREISKLHAAAPAEMIPASEKDKLQNKRRWKRARANQVDEVSLSEMALNALVIAEKPRDIYNTSQEERSTHEISRWRGMPQQRGPKERVSQWWEKIKRADEPRGVVFPIYPATLFSLSLSSSFLSLSLFLSCSSCRPEIAYANIHMLSASLAPSWFVLLYIRQKHEIRTPSSIDSISFILPICLQ